ncbi:hypothetical protein MMC28_010575 [Mycoblastus sanguinarius]|nr:hypothetical protein [Mycoblastus sanguinarius]
MPVSSNTLSDLKKTVARLDFLLTIPNIKIKKISTDGRDCSICQDPFHNNTWKAGETANRPVKLECGHMFGIQCLARLVFTSDFSNRCPLCRATIIPDSFEKNPSSRSWEVASPLLRLLTGLDRQITLVKAESINMLQRTQEKWTSVEGKHMDRTMILYEEFLNQFCDHPAMGDGNNAGRSLAAEVQARELRDLLRRDREFHTRTQDLNAQIAQNREVIIRTEAERDLLEARNITEVIGKELLAAQTETNDVKKALKVANKERKEVKRELEAINLKKRSTLLSLLVGSLITVVIFHILGDTAYKPEDFFDLTGTICITMAGAVFVVAASQSASWRTAFERGVLPVAFLALVFFNINSA